MSTFKRSSAGHSRTRELDSKQAGSGEVSAHVETEEYRKRVAQETTRHFCAAKLSAFLAFMMAEYARRELVEEDANDLALRARRELKEKRAMKKMANYMGVEEVDVRTAAPPLPQIDARATPLIDGSKESAPKKTVAPKRRKVKKKTIGKLRDAMPLPKKKTWMKTKILHTPSKETYRMIED